MDPTVMPKKLWEHPDPTSTAMYGFMQRLNRERGAGLSTFADLHRFSIQHRDAFWSTIWDAAGYIHEGNHGGRVVDHSQPVDAVPAWFEGVSLNWAENSLYFRDRSVGSNNNNNNNNNDPTARTTSGGKEDDRVAVTEVREGGTSTRDVTWGELRRRAGELAAALAARGVGRGDRVVIVGANGVETLLVWLAAAWVGAVFSSSSTDMGADGILQRTAQVRPRLLFFDDAALYNGKVTDLRAKMADVARGLRERCGDVFEGVVAIPRFHNDARGDVGDVAETWDELLRAGRGKAPPPFTRLAFRDPFLVCYSSGTTGTPKAIVHSVGGLLLNFYKEAVLHEDVGSSTVALQFTTTGWIMYVATAGALLLGARTVLYDGSPFVPHPRMLVELVGRLGVTKLGVSPRWMLELAKAGLAPRELADLSKLKVVSSTGMVLSDQLFEWFYEKGFPAHVQLGNISGGTDIAGTFGVMNPLTPVYLGGTQGPSLGLDVRIFDSQSPDGAGRELPAGEPGELVVVNSFPNAPPFFWNDLGDPAVSGNANNKTGTGGAPPGSKYHASYFARFEHAWAHGDFCAVHPLTGGLHFLGRSDGVLNPSGVRFGSAEIYAVLEGRRFAGRVADSLCVGQRRPGDPDERVMLFLLMREGCRFDARLEAEVREAIARDLSKRHVPKYIFETPEIPTTVNMKKVELPVKQIVSGTRVKPSGTLANPQSLEYYYQFAEVEKLVGGKAKL
ncbi:hypothetical protein RB594_008215 [Gaeumannomyces avenae]